MFQPLLDLIQNFIDQVSRIADALELIAKSTYYKEDVSIKEKELKRQQREEAEAQRKETLDELAALKIPYSAEMSNEQLAKRLNDNREKAIEKLKAEAAPKEETKPAPEPEKKAAPKKATPKKADEPKAPVAEETKEDEAVAMGDEELRAACKEICQVKGDAWLIKFFEGYKFESPTNKISGITQAERRPFITAAAKASKAEG